MMTKMITITKHQEIVDDKAGEEKLRIKVSEMNFMYPGLETNVQALTLTFPEARELLEALKEKLK